MESSKGAEDEREATLADVSAAFARQDHGFVLATMSRDIEIVVPGGTSFAGTYKGQSDALRWLLTMRDAFVPADDPDQPDQFSHTGDDMVIRQLAVTDGQRWMNVFRFTFEDSLIKRIAWEPEDLAAFDALIERVVETQSPDAKPWWRSRS